MGLQESPNHDAEMVSEKAQYTMQTDNLVSFQVEPALSDWTPTIRSLETVVISHQMCGSETSASTSG